LDSTIINYYLIERKPSEVFRGLIVLNGLTFVDDLNVATGGWEE
jgi:hypothetical protein